MITPLKIGAYSVTVEAHGFKKEIRPGVTLQVQDRVRVDFALQVGSVSEAIEVQADAAVVQTDSSALGDVIGSRQITDLPLNGRDYTQLATLLRAWRRSARTVGASTDPLPRPTEMREAHLP